MSNPDMSAAVAAIQTLIYCLEVNKCKEFTIFIIVVSTCIQLLAEKFITIVVTLKSVNCKVDFLLRSLAGFCSKHDQINASFTNFLIHKNSRILYFGYFL